MFKVFVVVFLASGGPPQAAGAGRHEFPTLEACQAELTSTDPSDPLSLAAGKAFFEARLGQEVRLSAACVEVDENGAAIHEDQLPSRAEQE